MNTQALSAFFCVVLVVRVPSFDQEQHKRGNEDVEHGNWKEELPAELHELVVAEAGQRPSDQKQKPAEEKHLKGKGSDLQHSNQQLR